MRAAVLLLLVALGSADQPRGEGLQVLTKIFVDAIAGVEKDKNKLDEEWAKRKAFCETSDSEDEALIDELGNNIDTLDSKITGFTKKRDSCQETVDDCKEKEQEEVARRRTYFDKYEDKRKTLSEAKLEHVQMVDLLNRGMEKMNESKGSSSMGDVKNIINKFKDDLETALSDLTAKLNKANNNNDADKLESQGLVKSLKTKENDHADQRDQAKSDLGEAKKRHGQAVNEKKLTEAHKKAVKENCAKREKLYNSDEAALSEQLKESRTAKEGFEKTQGKVGGFLQMSSDVNPEATAVLMGAARKYKSKEIAAIAVAVSQGGVFDKVTDMVNKLIGKLQDENANDTTSSNKCEKELAENKDARDKSQADFEKAKSSQEANEAKQLSSKKSKGKATKLKAKKMKQKADAAAERSEERKENEHIISEFEGYRDGIKNAVSEIPKLQNCSEGEVPAEDAVWNLLACAIRKSQTTYDNAAQKFKDSEKAKQEAWEEADHESDMAIDAADSDASFYESEENKFDSNAKSDSSDRQDAKKGNEIATTKYEKVLKPECIDASETHEERQAARAAEIQSLKEALDILKARASDE